MAPGMGPRGAPRARGRGRGEARSQECKWQGARCQEVGREGSVGAAVPSPGRLISMPSWPGWMAVVNARYRRAGHPRLPGVQKGQSSAELDKNRQRPDQGATWSRPGNQVALGLEMSIDDLNDLVHVVGEKEVTAREHVEIERSRRVPGPCLGLVEGCLRIILAG